MAFAVTNQHLGSAGDKWRMDGTWSGSVGDAEGTVSVSGVVYQSSFDIQDAQSGEDRPVPTSVSYSTTSGLSTITVYNSVNVTTGRFTILFR